MKLTVSTMIFTLLLTLNVGCFGLKQSVTRWKPLTMFAGSKSLTSDSKPASLAVIWKDSVYEKPGVPSVKGFGGRVFIYDADNNPVKSEGELIVYGYDESNPSRSDSGADKKFIFPQEKFQQHFSESELGPSYSVWVPWEKVGGFRKSITLIPVFKTADGNLLRCGQSINVLPGKKPNSDTDVSKNLESANVIAQVSFQKPDISIKKPELAYTNGATTIKKQKLRTTTLNVPESLARKLAAGSTPATVNSNTQFPHPNKKTTNSNLKIKKLKATKKSKPIEAEARIFGVPGSF